MLNITRKIKRLKLSGAVAACAVIALFLAVGTARAQSPDANYTTRGIAPVSGGNISAARIAALTDAQQKAVLAALADQIPLEKLSSSFASLYNLFISRPDVYVQRFKILKETTISGNYHILIETVIEDALMRADLESIGVHGPVKQKMKVLLMVAEAAPDETYRGWWAVDPDARILPVNVGTHMAHAFRERGVGVIDEGTIDLASLAPSDGDVFPGQDSVLSAARQAGADVVVLARTDLKQTGSQPEASSVQMQCDIHTEVLDVHMRETVLQTATNALGVNSEEALAAQDAAEKACSRIVEHVLDKVLPAISGRHTFVLRCTFTGSRPESDAQDFFSLLRAALPEIVHINVRDTANANVLLADIVSDVDATAFAQKTLQAELYGYVLTPGTMDDDVINLIITPPGKP